jgi:hypothetical protein
MGVANTGFRLRASTPNTVAGFIETANTYWQALEDAGMQRVSAANYAGQAGRLVSGTAGTDETQFTALGTANGQGAWYYNVYKHPVLNFYLRAAVNEAGFSGATHRWAWIRAEFFFELDGAGGHVPSGYLAANPLDWYSSAGVSTAANGITAAYKNLYVSVGDDHLWIGSEPVSFPITTQSYPGFYYAPGHCGVGYGIFADTDGAGSLALLLPARAVNYGGGTSGSFYWGASDPALYNNAYQYSAIRYWTCEPGAKTWLFRGGAAAGFILDAATPSTSVGTRVQQGQLYINGVLRKFNFGFVPEAAVTDAAVLELNLTGAGAGKFRAMKGFGPANPGIAGNSSTTGYDTTSNSAIILPWNSP